MSRREDMTKSEIKGKLNWEYPYVWFRVTAHRGQSFIGDEVD